MTLMCGTALYGPRYAVCPRCGYTVCRGLYCTGLRTRCKCGAWVVAYPHDVNPKLQPGDLPTLLLTEYEYWQEQGSRHGWRP